ncbi:MAG: hypothetical protein KJZ83_16015 [Burkholderiaceae bacterium]|nr:hypothetical protein [Burkholderiaceae bacterium]
MSAARRDSARDEWLLVRREGEPGLTVLDLSAPGSPRVAGSLALPDAVPDAALLARNASELFVATRDGEVLRYGLARRELLARARVASRIAAIALASDGRHLAVAAQDPPALLVLDAKLGVLRTLAGEDKERKRSVGVLAVRNSPARRSFVASLPGLPELWEVSYDPAALDIPAGMIHDFQFREGAFVRGYLNARRTPLDAALRWLALDPLGHEAIGGSPAGTGIEVVHLDVRRRIAGLALDAGPRARRPVFWGPPERRSMALVDIAGGGVAIVDATLWKFARKALAGTPVRWLASHRETRWIWVSVGAGCEPAQGCAQGELQLLDKGDPGGSAIARDRLAPRIRRGVVQVAFDRPGQHAYAAVSGARGGVAVVSADATRELAFLPLAEAVELVVLPD